VPRPRLIVVLLAVAVTAAACSGAGEPADPGRAADPSPATNATSAPLLPTTTDGLPEIDPEGFATLMEQLRGTPVLVNVWGSWCAPCRTEAPELAEAAERYGDRIQFLGIDIQDERSSARAFIGEFGWSYPSVFDPTGQVRGSLGYSGQPVTLFYDADGTLVHDRQGPIGPDELDEHLREILPV
jgi:thiol-disulfide isomerase/thioredoxin